MENIIYRRVLSEKVQQREDMLGAVVGGIACKEANGYSVWVCFGHPDGYETRFNCFIDGCKLNAREEAIDVAYSHYHNVALFNLKRIST